jgi:hypothetical protein
MAKHKKESLEKLLKLIEEISSDSENLWFKEELSKRFQNDSTKDDDIFKNTETIKKHLSISPQLSIDYSFINHNILKNRLELDNLRMENVRIDLKEKDEIKRIYDYIIYAFYQIENLINFFYFSKYPDIKDFIIHLESIPYTKFKKNSYQTDISDITISTKIYTFNRTYFKIDEASVGYSIDSLRRIRNEGLHRCTVIIRKGSNNENEKLYRFLKNANYDSIHRTLEVLTLKIKENI